MSVPKFPHGRVAPGPRGAPVAVLDLPDRIVREVFGYDLILVRPDLHIVWRGNATPEDAAEVAAIATGHLLLR